MPWAILVLGLLITWQAWLGQSRYNEVELHAEFEARVVDGANRVQLRMDSYQQVLRGVAGLLSAGAEVDRQQFRAYVQALGLAERFPGIQGVGFNMLVPAQAREAHGQAVRRSGVPAYDLRPPGARDPYPSLGSIQPLARPNLRASGLSPVSEAPTRSAQGRRRGAGARV